jgi:pyridoxamine 5'-phosphate oxidase
MSIADIRKDYRQHSFGEADAQEDAMEQFKIWWEEAVRSEIEEVNAMTLATASSDGVPAARIVLLKGFDARGFSFFTNYESFKGLHLQENPRACLVFFWKELERQIRIMGVVEKLPSAESDAYFQSRPEGSRIGAWVSPQSQVIPSRDWLEHREQELTAGFSGKTIDRPAHWGGYLVRPVALEFWQGRPSRLHDRIQYTLKENGGWQKERLAP